MCGDIVTAVIDSRDSRIANSIVRTTHYRSMMKRVESFSNDAERDIYITEVSAKYLSISSHNSGYHISRNHKVISVGVVDYEDAIWAAHRFRNSMPMHIWLQFVMMTNLSSIEQYAEWLLIFTKKISEYASIVIPISDIRNGKLIDTLQPLLETELDSSFYAEWLSSQR